MMLLASFATRRSEEDAMMWGLAAVLGVLAVAGVITSITLFAKKKSLTGVLVLVGAALSGLAALAVAGLMILAMFAWH